MPVYDATPATWTLKFKNARTTVVLHIDKLQSLSSIKSELLHALRTTNPSGELNGTPLPTSPDDIELAKPVDFANIESGGWQSIELDARADEAELFDEEEPKTKGKGKAKAKANSHRDCPLGAGLKDMCPVAFRFKDQKLAPKDEDEDEGLGLEDDIEAAGWNVELPKFEDVYGLENLVPDDQLVTPKASKFADVDY